MYSSVRKKFTARESMNKAELSNILASKVGTTRQVAEKFLNEFVDVAIAELKKGGEVTLVGFGTFSARQRKGRVGVHPRNPKQSIDMPSVVVPKFKAGKRLKDALKGRA